MDKKVGVMKYLQISNNVRSNHQLAKSKFDCFIPATITARLLWLIRGMCNCGIVCSFFVVSSDGKNRING